MKSRRRLFKKKAAADDDSDELPHLAPDCLGYVVSFIGEPAVFFNLLLMNHAWKEFFEREAFENCVNIRFILSAFEKYLTPENLLGKRYLIDVTIDYYEHYSSLEFVRFLDYARVVRFLRQPKFSHDVLCQLPSPGLVTKIVIDESSWSQYHEADEGRFIAQSDSFARFTVLEELRLLWLKYSVPKLPLGCLQVLETGDVDVLDWSGLKDSPTRVLKMDLTSQQDEVDFDDIVSTLGDHLECLRISHADADFSCSIFSKLHNLTGLALTNLEDCVDESLYGLLPRSITTLSLLNIGTPLDAKGAKQLPVCESLKLGFLDVSQDFLEVLPCEKCEKLWLITLNGFEGAGIERFTGLKSLELRNMPSFKNNEGLSQLLGLETVRLALVPLLEDGAFRFADFLREVDVANCVQIGWPAVARLKTVEVLKLSEPLAVKSFGDFRLMKTLQILEIGRLEISYDSVQFPPTLVRLAIYGGDVTDAHISSLPLLEDLKLDSCPSVNGQCLRDLSRLRVLALSKKGVTEAALKSAPDSLEELRVTRVGIGSFRFARRLKSLRRLYVTAESLRALAGPAVRLVVLMSCEVSDRVGIHGMDTLRLVRLFRCVVDADALCKRLKHREVKIEIRD